MTEGQKKEDRTQDSWPSVIHPSNVLGLLLSCDRRSYLRPQPTGLTFGQSEWPVGWWRSKIKKEGDAVSMIPGSWKPLTYSRNRIASNSRLTFGQIIMRLFFEHLTASPSLYIFFDLRSPVLGFHPSGGLRPIKNLDGWQPKVEPRTCDRRSKKRRRQMTSNRWQLLKPSTFGWSD